MSLEGDFGGIGEVIWQWENWKMEWFAMEFRLQYLEVFIENENWNGGLRQNDLFF